MYYWSVVGKVLSIRLASQLGQVTGVTCGRITVRAWTVPGGVHFVTKRCTFVTKNAPLL